MQSGGASKVQKTHKTKFKRTDNEVDSFKFVKKQKKRDKQMYKIQRQEEKEYVV